MLDWIKTLALEAEAIPEGKLLEPPEECGPEEKVLGEVSTALRQLYTRSQLAREKSLRAAIDARYDQDPEVRQKAQIENQRLESESDTIMEIFWYLAKDEWDAWGHAAVGIRRGWLLVVITKPRQPKLSDIFKIMPE